MNLTVLVFSASLIMGQAEMSNYEHLKDYGDAVVGKWKAEWPAEMAVPGLAEVGDTVTIEVTSKWALNKNAVVTEWKASINGKPVGTGMGTIGWDKSAKRIVGYSFNSLGGRDTIVEKRGDAWYHSDRGIGLDGFSGASMTLITFVNDDTHEHLSIGRIDMQGKPMPNKTFTYRRVK